MTDADEIVTELVNKWDNRWDEFTDPQSRSELEVAIAAALRKIEANCDEKLRVWKAAAGEYEEQARYADALQANAEAERDKLRKLNQEAGTYVESVICMRTHFTGEPPYVGWEGLGLALNEVLDERDRLAKEVERLRAALTDIARQHTSAERKAVDEDEGDLEDAYDIAIELSRKALSPFTPEGGGE